MGTTETELLGAHVSTAGGVHLAPARGEAIGATAIQIFTKTPSQWREPIIKPAIAKQFRHAMRCHGIRAVVSHDSYLINLASPNKALRERSMACFSGELTRCRVLGIKYVVTHPGNFMDERAAGVKRNAASYARCLRSVRGVNILLETTAGTGTALGSTFDELATLRMAIPGPLKRRVGFCADTCHLFSAGYDLANDWQYVWKEWDAIIGMKHLKCMHLNDSKTPFDSRRDRHELIGEGSLGREPFRRVMTDPRFRDIIKIIETPKGDDVITTDRRMLARLRRFQRTSFQGR